MLKYYAQLDVQNVCVGVSQLAGVVDSDNLVELDSYDISVLGKLWQSGKWVDNPGINPRIIYMPRSLPVPLRCRA